MSAKVEQFTLSVKLAKPLIFTSSLLSAPHDRKTRTNRFALRAIRLNSGSLDKFSQNEQQQKSFFWGIDIRERIIYFLFSVAALKINLLPAPHAERPGRGYFFPKIQVIHAN
jgi:hypothetical protein